MSAPLSISQKQQQIYDFVMNKTAKATKKNLEGQLNPNGTVDTIEIKGGLQRAVERIKQNNKIKAVLAERVAQISDKIAHLPKALQDIARKIKIK